MKYTVDWLLDLDNPEFLFFWKHMPDKSGKFCLSQWSAHSFTVDNIVYKTAEHWMMAEKARLFNDTASLSCILESSSPKDAKEFGKKVKNFNSYQWDKKKYNLVVQGNIQKFLQNPTIANFLKQTKDKILVEASPYDTIWGIGLDETHCDATDPLSWKGENLLGFVLMEVRDYLNNVK